jgi:nitroimidazol reductase NimA-like FMN-containing flavoprotein (pyridoxamine 5'-phosphate oxidase superfamily)
MLEVEDLDRNESVELLVKMGYGHLACCESDRPYVVPIHYAFSNDNVYVYTTV